MLITGSTGLLGPYLVEAAAGWGQVYTTSRTGGGYPGDLTDPDAARAIIDATSPEVIVHAAAMTNVDACETDPNAADRANCQATEILVRTMPVGAFLVFLSTDQVYPDSPGPHVEGQEAPANVYGSSKLAGEKAALKHRQTLVVRTNLFGPSRTPGRTSLSDFVVNSLSARRSITLFEDVIFSPLHATTLTTVIGAMLDRGLTGTFNAASRSGMSKAEFACRIADRFGLQKETATKGYSTLVPGRARRPLDLRMDPSRLEGQLGYTMPTLEEEIARL